MELHLFDIFLHVIIVENVFATLIFNTLPSNRISRRTSFKPKVISKTCLLKPDHGPCRGNINMFYYDPPTVECKKFKWGGCQGNGNRFDSAEECNATCLSSPGYRTPKPQYCNLRFDYGYCFGAIYRWYYDSMWKVCKETIFSGCGGNKNNFYSQSACESVCRFNKKLDFFKKKESKDKMSKVVIINPLNTTPRRGLNQSTEAPPELKSPEP